ncbi:hypothetical protein JHD50_09900 [Sulfurimonas sp. MAG313]|nr:hypothetical protein [Sulfurimonas sp. MAG313]MDF1881612.1 hypothetical protein [Sulfurimonas sp. MAG313]
MKTMTCKQLGGACDKVFKAETFDEMAELSRAHGMQMFQEGDAAHMKVIQEMMVLMNNPEAMKKWLDTKKLEFSALKDD